MLSTIFQTPKRYNEVASFVQQTVHTQCACVCMLSMPMFMSQMKMGVKGCAKANKLKEVSKK